MAQLFLAFFTVALVIDTVHAQTSHRTEAQSSENQPQASAVKIILAGDSTTAQGTGWGGAFCDTHVTSMTGCLTIGRGGRSTKTYRSEGSWRLVLDELKTPGYTARYVLIEFGHNDKNVNPAIGTSLEQGEFAANLSRFVEEVRQAGGVPVLVTPLAARHFRSNQLNDTLSGWAIAVRSVALRTGVPLIDLNRVSGILYQRIGAVGALSFETLPITADEVEAARAGTTLPARTPGPSGGPSAYTADYIHLNRDGAAQISSLVAEGLLQAVPTLRAYVIP